jgi:hypothetical protein
LVEQKDLSQREEVNGPQRDDIIIFWEAKRKKIMSNDGILPQNRSMTMITYYLPDAEVTIETFPMMACGIIIML